MVNDNKWRNVYVFQGNIIGTYLKPIKEGNVHEKISNNLRFSLILVGLVGTNQETYRGGNTLHDI